MSDLGPRICYFLFRQLEKLQTLLGTELPPMFEIAQIAGVDQRHIAFSPKKVKAQIFTPSQDHKKHRMKALINLTFFSKREVEYVPVT